MATVGQQLTAPEVGWRRYDDVDTRIAYSSAFTRGSDASCYKGTLSLSTVSNSYIQFKVKSSRLRIISVYSGSRCDSIDVYVDNVKVGSYTDLNATVLYQSLSFQYTFATNDVHTIKLVGNNITSTKFFMIDAIDIDSDGYLLHPILNQISDVSKAKTGDCIPCRYTASTSGAIGTFSQLGTCIMDEIPVTASATPDGLFYFICIGYEYNGQPKFIADRNVQHSISWDTILNSGMVYDSTTKVDATNYNIRLLSGGLSTSDLNNEWDKIIIGSDLNSLITAGDNNIWHWSGIYSWTNSARPDSAQYRIGRGSTMSGRDTAPSANTYTTYGFRPVLISTISIVYKYLLKQGTSYYSIAPTYYDSGAKNFSSLVLTGGLNPNRNDILNFGFNDVSSLYNTMNVGADSFRPIDIFFNKFDIKVYKITQ